MSDTKLGGSLEQGRLIPFAVGEVIGKLKAVVSLDPFYSNRPVSIPLERVFFGKSAEE